MENVSRSESRAPTSSFCHQLTASKPPLAAGKLSPVPADRYNFQIASRQQLRGSVQHVSSLMAAPRDDKTLNVMQQAMNKTTTKRMFKAIEDHDAAILSAILDEHSDAIERFGEHNRNVRDKTPLMFAMQCSDFDLAHSLLDRGANAAAEMADGPRLSALALCAKFGYCDAENHDDWITLAKRLLDQGADPTSGLWPALHGFGGSVNRADLIRLMLERGADSGQKLGDTGSTIRELVEINRQLYSDEVLDLFGITGT